MLRRAILRTLLSPSSSSQLLQQAAPVTRPAVPLQLVWGSRCISNSSCVCMGQGSQMSDNDPHMIKHYKEQHLKGHTPEHIPGVEGWSSPLASESEAVVKAERALSSVPEGPEVFQATIASLQEHTISVVQQLDEEDAHVEGKSEDMSDRPAMKANIEHMHQQKSPDEAGSSR